MSKPTPSAAGCYRPLWKAHTLQPCSSYVKVPNGATLGLEQKAHSTRMRVHGHIFHKLPCQPTSTRTVRVCPSLLEQETWVYTRVGCRASQMSDTCRHPQQQHISADLMVVMVAPTMQLSRLLTDVRRGKPSFAAAAVQQQAATDCHLGAAQTHGYVSASLNTT